MLVIGARGHAKEVLIVLEQCGYNSNSICFYDDVNLNSDTTLFQKYLIIQSKAEAISYLEKEPEICIGIGGTSIREKLAKKFSKFGNLVTVIAPSSIIGNHNVFLGAGVNVMINCFISNSVKIGEGTLVNSGASIHHDCDIGNYCEIGPGVVVLGNVNIGNQVFIGANTTILPNVKVCEGVTIGAGAVVTRNIDTRATYVGVPARILK